MQSITELFATLETLGDLAPAAPVVVPAKRRPAHGFDAIRQAEPAPVVHHHHTDDAHAHNDLSMEGRLATAADAKAYILGGHAIITLRSKKTGQRFTYKVSAPKNSNGDMFFVGLLTGPDNYADYQYFGYIKREIYWHGRVKAKVGEDAPSQKAFAWAWSKIVKGELPEALEVWHQGSCGRCGRKLTVPSSIASGFGPECVKHVGG